MIYILVFMASLSNGATMGGAVGSYDTSRQCETRAMEQYASVKAKIEEISEQKVVKLEHRCIRHPVEE